MLVYRHGASLEHDPGVLVAGHPDTPERIKAIEAEMEAAGWAGAQVREAPAAGEQDLRLAHSAEHVAAIRDLAESGGGLVDAETYVAAGSYRAALHAAGGACALVGALLCGEDEAGFCMLRPSGHHAERDRAMGFCLFNNVAIAAELALRETAAARVLIVDWDVHHGNGTAEIFRRRDDVLFASIHQQGLYPGTGAMADAGSGAGRGFTLNAPVPPGSGEDTWISVLEYVIVPVALQYDPDLVLISAGYDAHRDDPMADCLLEDDSFAQMACHVRDCARACGAPVGAVLEGGYAPPALARSVLATMHALGGEGAAESIAPEQIVTPRLAGQASRYWDL